MTHPKPKQPPDGLSCGCCRGPEEDRCCCHMHQDIPRGFPVKVCSRHQEKPMSYRPMMEFSNQPPVGNALRFETEAEAEAAAKDLFSRWTVPSGWHVKLSDDPVNYKWDLKRQPGDNRPGLIPLT